MQHGLMRLIKKTIFEVILAANYMDIKSLLHLGCAKDATWIDAFDKKTIFEVILAANYMDIKSLLHLGCAKIATLIKQLDQKEINRIIEEEEKYRREHANDNNDDAKTDEKDNK